MYVVLVLLADTAVILPTILFSTTIHLATQLSNASNTFMMCCFTIFVVSPAVGIKHRSLLVILIPFSSLDPYENVIRSGCFFLDVIFTIVPRALRLCIRAMPFCLGISLRMYRWVSVTSRWLKWHIETSSLT